MTKIAVGKNFARSKRFAVVRHEYGEIAVAAVRGPATPKPGEIERLIHSLPLADFVGDPEPARGQPVRARGQGKLPGHGPPATGLVVGVRRFCTLEGCGARRLIVRWPDGKRTEPCLRGCEWDRAEQCWRIL